MAVVERIVDGDTIWVQAVGPGPLQQNASHNIRLLEIDTPETQNQQECWGPEATAFAEERLPVGSTVYLQADQEDTDQYGRFLRYICTEDGDFFNAEAVVNGHAEAVLYEPNDSHIDALEEAEQRARDAGRGMWGDRATTTTRWRNASRPLHRPRRSQSRGQSPMLNPRRPATARKATTHASRRTRLMSTART